MTRIASNSSLMGSVAEFSVENPEASSIDSRGGRGGEGSRLSLKHGSLEGIG